MFFIPVFLGSSALGYSLVLLIESQLLDDIVISRSLHISRNLSWHPVGRCCKYSSIDSSDRRFFSILTGEYD